MGEIVVNVGLENHVRSRNSRFRRGACGAGGPGGAGPPG